MSKIKSKVKVDSAGLLTKIFGHDFTRFINNDDFRTAFFKKKLGLAELKLVHSYIDSQTINLGCKTIASALLITPQIQTSELPFMLLTQIHGNEPAGLAGALYVIALNQAKLLKKPVIVVIGNELAAEQYFETWQKNPDLAQETRDVYRRGIGVNGHPLPDMNRLPNNFRQLDPASSHAAERWQALDLIADNVQGVIDIHTARGQLICMTDSSDNSMLQNSPIRNIMTNLTEAIGSATDTSTFKTIASKKT